MTRSDRVCTTVFALCIVGMALPSPTHSTESQLVDFELKDQFKRVHRRADIAGDIVLLVGSDKNGSAFTAAWTDPAYEALKDHPNYERISQLPHADLRGVPFFAKGFVRGAFPEDPDQWVLMDWKGTLAEAYEFTPDSCNLLVFAPDGTLVHRVAGQEPDDEALRSLIAILRKLLDEE